MSDGRGLPLLSGPLPQTSSSSRADIGCRKCGKEFNILFSRGRRCNHCGHSYCQSCSDYQALMPRQGNESGYDAVNVCGYCIEFLNITASSRSMLKSMPVSKLKKYAGAYNIKVDRAVEKDDFVDAIMAARGPNGCISQVGEAYYRKYSVPDKTNYNRSRGIFNRHPPQPPPVPPRPRTPPRTEFARPDLAPDDFPPYVPPHPDAPNPPPRPGYNPSYAPPPPPPVPPGRPTSAAPQYAPPPGPPPMHNRPPPHTHFTPPPFVHPNPQYAFTPRSSPRGGAAPRASPYSRPTPSRSSHNLPNENLRTPPSRPRSASSVPAQGPPPPIPIPTLDDLLNMTSEAIRSLSISVLKSILFNNHVTANNTTVLEKSDLVRKVLDLVDDERKERESRRLAEEREEAERIALQKKLMEALEQKKRAEAAAAAEAAGTSDNTQAESSQSGATNESSTDSKTEEAKPTGVNRPPPPPPLPQNVERSGLCVVCQDEEANIAIVDCGHLAMCRGCSDLIMAGTRECPLCRTRIVTEARLLRIFKT